jgi:hypothetical protein
MSQVKSLRISARILEGRSGVAGCPRRVKVNERAGRPRSVLLKIVGGADRRATHSSVQRFEFLEVPAFASSANSATLANG